jgi:hypothetical protein
LAIAPNGWRCWPFRWLDSLFSPLREALILVGDIQHHAPGNDIGHQLGLDACFLGARSPVLGIIEQLGRHLRLAVEKWALGIMFVSSVGWQQRKALVLVGNSSSNISVM